ncbi:hypothetical protein [Desulfitobacterium sp. AusDCA]|uniref:hypothetical protein n=1 Tax=Desulfitobacterium sp. AusDCA TaxID=3240383 RepID=UPI003DA7A0EE
MQRDQEDIIKNRATQFAWKFVAEHRVDDGGEHILSKNVFDVSDDHLEKTFKNCVVPLNSKYYELCRSIIFELVKDYKIEN